MRKFFMLVCLMSVLLGVSFAAAQKSDNVPYLYYYSRMLGGIIIEHPDGSDSRLIGADVIPPNLTGISGPGWSPSGKYFAGYGFIYDAYYSTTKAAYVLDQAGNTVSKWLSDMNAFGMRWSPTDEDLLLIEGVRAPDMGDYARYRSFWIMDVSTGSILADDVENCGCTAYEFSPVIWETDKSRIRFYTRPETDESNRAYQITMQFDGTVLKQPITDAEFSAHYVAPDVTGGDPDPFDAHGISPSGDYEASGKYPTILRNRLTGEEVDLPTHSQGTICRAYRWSEHENYIITLDGTLLAGGGCAPAVLGITDSRGQLWRELGGCSWDEFMRELAASECRCCRTAARSAETRPA